MNSEDRNGKRKPDPEEAGHWLRESLAPSREQVDRVVRHALESAEAARTGRRLYWGLAAAAALLGLLVWVSVARAVRVEPAKQPAEMARERGAVAIPTITNTSGDVQLLLPPGWEAQGGRASAKGIQEIGRAEVFNSDGCVAAVLPKGRIRYYIIGGDA
jgi:hypothetical protein